jgi:hypothetical protein
VPCLTGSNCSKPVRNIVQVELGLVTITIGRGLLHGVVQDVFRKMIVALVFLYSGFSSHQW